LAKFDRQGAASLTVLMLACLWGSGAASFPKTNAQDPDAQGWNGPGWYLTNAPSLYIGSEATLAYILFSGSYTMKTGYLEVYDRLYSPIGFCRFLNLKPAVSPDGSHS
jgi:hypothetical protein